MSKEKQKKILLEAQKIAAKMVVNPEPYNYFEEEYKRILNTIQARPGVSLSAAVKALLDDRDQLVLERNKAENRVRELEGGHDQAAQAVVDAQASEVAWKDRAEKAESELENIPGWLKRLYNNPNVIEAHLHNKDPNGDDDDVWGCPGCGWVGGHSAKCSVKEERARINKLNQATHDMLEAVCLEMERAITSSENSKGGQQARPNYGDFWPVSPSVLNRYKWWVKEMRKLLK